MKSTRILTALLLGTALCATSAFAAGKSDKAKVQVNENVTVNGSELPKGSYTVMWEGSGQSMEVKFLKGKNVVATVPAHLVKLSSVTSDDQIVVLRDGGSASLTEVQPAGKDFALAIGGDSAQTAADASVK